MDITMSRHDKISALVTTDQNTQDIVVGLRVVGPRVFEFQELLSRALNTWENRPAWAVDLADAIEAHRKT